MSEYHSLPAKQPQPLQKQYSEHRSLCCVWYQSLSLHIQKSNYPATAAQTSVREATGSPHFARTEAKDPLRDT